MGSGRPPGGSRRGRRGAGSGSHDRGARPPGAGESVREFVRRDGGGGIRSVKAPSAETS